MSLTVNLASEADRDSLAAWLQHNSVASATDPQKASLHTQLLQCQIVLRRKVEDFTANLAGSSQQLGLDMQNVVSQLDAHASKGGFGGDASVTKEDAECCFRQITSLKLLVWAEWQMNQGYDGWEMDMTWELSIKFWDALQTARVQQLILGEFPSDDFVKQLHALKVPIANLNPDILLAPSLMFVEALTLHLTWHSVQTLFWTNGEGSVSGLRDLSRLTSLTLAASEVHPNLHNGERKRHAVPADRLLHSLPDMLCMLRLHNFRERWTCFQDLSSKPSLIKLDLSGSNFIFPESYNWAQLHSLTLRDSVVWAVQQTPIEFHALTRLTSLEMPACQFNVYTWGGLGNTHDYKISRLQAPTSIVKLDINTRCITVRLHQHVEGIC